MLSQQRIAVSRCGLGQACFPKDEMMDGSSIAVSGAAVHQYFSEIKWEIIKNFVWNNKKTCREPSDCSRQGSRMPGEFTALIYYKANTMPICPLAKTLDFRAFLPQLIGKDFYLLEYLPREPVKNTRIFPGNSRLGPGFIFWNRFIKNRTPVWKRGTAYG